MASDLRGRSILVTRPRAQAGSLARLIQEAGGHAHLFPAIEIEDVAPPPTLARLHEFDFAIFISPTAVARAMPHVRKLPRVAAVGGGTRRALEERGVAGVIAPRTGADSEALLEVSELKNIKGKSVAILRGDGGRELLGETLAARGARVEHVSCYRRRRPDAPSRQWRTGELAAVTVSSSQGLANLFEVLDGEMLRSTPLFVPHARIAERARALSVREVQLAGHGDDEMIGALVAYFRSHG